MMPRPVIATGFPGGPNVFGLSRQNVAPQSSYSFSQNIQSRVGVGWTQNPLDRFDFTGGYQGNGFNGSNV